MRKGFIAVLLATLLLTGCNANNPPDPVIIDDSGINQGIPPHYPKDQIVLQLSHGGGLLLPSRASDAIADVTIWGNGRVVFAAPDGTIRDGNLDSQTLDTLMAEAYRLVRLEDYYSAVNHTDAATAVFTIATSYQRKTVSVYGLNPVEPYDDEPHPWVFGILRQLWTDVQAALPADAPELAPAEVYVMISYTDEEPTEHWPPDLEGFLEGEDAQRAVELGGLGEAKSFLVDGKAQRVLVIPVVPRLDQLGQPPSRPPHLLAGQGKDSNIALDVRAELQPEGDYKVTVTVQNLTNRGIPLLYNCGSLLWWEGLPSTSADQSDRTCPAAYSSLVEAGRSVTFEELLAPEEAEGWPSPMVRVWYEKTDGGRSSTLLGVRLQPVAP